VLLVEAIRDLKTVRESLENPDVRSIVTELPYLGSDQQGMAALLADAGLFNLDHVQPSSSAPNLFKVPKNWDFHGTSWKANGHGEAANQRHSPNVCS
jgi:hypothetical protein